MDPVMVIALWLHTVAFVVAWGYYGILGRVILPGLGRALGPDGQVASLASMERRALPLIGISLVLFTVTGAYLLVGDPEYAGLGNVLASTWTVLMLVKHVVVVAMIAVGVVVDVLVRRLEATADDDLRRAGLHRVRLGAEAATALGALVALLTVAAQAAS